MADYKKVQIVDSNGNLLDEVNVKDEVARNGLAGKVAKSGDVMTGNLATTGTAYIIRRDGDKLLIFKDASDQEQGALYLSNSNHRMAFRMYDNDYSNTEVYNLPTPDSLTANKTYDILTSKNPVTLAQGGTGGTDSEWKTLTNPSVFTGSIAYRKIGVFVQVVLYAQTITDIAARSSRELATLPSGYRPTLPGGGSISEFAGNASIFGIVTITSAGVVSFTPSEAWGTSQIIRGSIMYLI